MSDLIKEIGFALVVFITHVIQAITGFAGTALAMPFSIRLVGLATARPILNIVAIIISIAIAFKDRKHINLKQLLMMIFFMGIGMAIGTLLESYLALPVLMQIYGLIIILLSLFYVIKNKSLVIEKKIGIVMIIIAGIIHKWFIAGGPILIIYATAKLKDKRMFRGTLSVLWIVLNLVIFGFDFANGLYTQRVWMLTPFIVLVIPLSFYIGSLIFDKIPQDNFMRIAYFLLLISGFAMLF